MPNQNVYHNKVLKARPAYQALRDNQVLKAFLALQAVLGEEEYTKMMEVIWRKMMMLCF